MFIEFKGILINLSLINEICKSSRYNEVRLIIQSHGEAEDTYYAIECDTKAEQDKIYKILKQALIDNDQFIDLEDYYINKDDLAVFGYKEKKDKEGVDDDRDKDLRPM